ncbi:MAG: DUF1223 domain-containing protein [Paracoccus denitrificans]|nr:MAG: DUF1223 domain-containing protein [Paracoccus denitrificans]PZO84476.1 MAG: DUF1223 domain-containing protein [Paracoccus denitrificans]
MSVAIGPVAWAQEMGSPGGADPASDADRSGPSPNDDDLSVTVDVDAPEGLGTDTGFPSVPMTDGVSAESLLESTPVQGAGGATVAPRASTPAEVAAGILNTPLPPAAQQRRGRAAAGDPQGDQGVVVVELFTSQGCASCPPADMVMSELAQRRDILALAWHVDYWDYLGWKDEFALPENTDRQEGYALTAGERGVYTPQVIVDGQDTLMHMRPTDLMGMIAKNATRQPAVGIRIAQQGGQQVVDLSPRTAVPGGVAVMLIRYAPERTVTIKAGENRGRQMTYANVVLGTELIQRWPAKRALRLRISPRAGATGGFPSDTRHALIAQQILPPPRVGPILNAVPLD